MDAAAKLIEEFDDFKIASVHKELRLCVIENSIFIEELASRVLGNILHIDWKTSRSFGSSSGCLSFVQKLQLIQDIKGIDKEDLKKITCLAQIRNKFAHSSVVNSFESLFTESSVGKDIKNSFLKWYFDKDGMEGIHPTKVEFVFRLCFYMLVNSVIQVLLKISDAHHYNEGVHDGKRAVQEQLLVFAMSVLTKEQKLEIHANLQELYPDTEQKSQPVGNKLG